MAEAAAPTVTAPPDSNPFADPASALPKQKNRKAWAQKARNGFGRTGKPIPPPAKPKEAKQFLKKLASEAAVAVATDTKLDAVSLAKYSQMSSVVRAHILSYLGEDVEAARAEFAHELMANARKCAAHLMENFAFLPPSVQSFLFTAFVDKSEALTAKAATNPKTAAVSIQINSFGPTDGSVDREALMRTLLGNFTGAPAAQPVQPVVPVEAKPA